MSQAAAFMAASFQEANDAASRNFAYLSEFLNDFVTGSGDIDLAAERKTLDNKINAGFRRGSLTVCLTLRAKRYPR